MAEHFDVSNAVIAADQGPTQMYLLKELLQTAGWTVFASCDQNGGNFSAVADVIDSIAEMAQVGAYIVLTDPTAARQILFGNRLAANTRNWYVAYSRGAVYAGGSNVAYPTAVDSTVLFGAVGVPAQLFINTNTYAHMWADDATGAFYLVNATQGTGKATTLIFLDPLDNPVTGDADPAVVGAMYSGGAEMVGTGGIYSDDNAVGVCAGTWFDLGGAGGGPAFQSVGLCRLEIYNQDTAFPHDGTYGVGVNLDDSKDPLIPGIWARSSASLGGAPYGYSGISSFIELLGTNRAPGSTLTTVGARDKVVFGAYRTAFPWNDTAPAV